ncbi:serine--tRNA ligase, mitochondrial-like [Mizuhopecten yessoensis]|uniref:serine--tRNA ligase, mitochondrial-like n=1 Tax=Mizuhopecten yessoensis TaxID=6573 RepID=UPI000B457CFF|nr:serine--tRNA ligase, mitochondrial-like [Mizuhopecten yessoensis]
MKMSLCLRLFHFGRQAWCRSFTQKNMYSVTNHCRQCRRHQHSVQRSSNISELESSLFVSGVYQDDSLLLSLDLDIEAMLHDLDSNLHSRKHTSWNSDHINQFKDNYRKFAEISVKLKNIEEDQKNTSFLFQSIKQKQKNSTLTKEEAEQERAVLRDKGRQLKLQHTSLMDEYLTLEQVVIFHALRIPNHLHIDTPNDELKELDRCGFPEKVEISNEKLNKTLKKCIKFSNIGRRSYYLMSNAALKEQELITSVSSGLRGSGFTHMVCPEIFKTIPVEGAGITPQDPKEVYKEPKKVGLASK